MNQLVVGCYCAVMVQRERCQQMVVQFPSPVQGGESPRLTQRAVPVCSGMLGFVLLRSEAEQ